MEKTYRVVILLPTYNERANLTSLIEKIKTHSSEWDILIIDDNSPDGTGEVGEKLMLKYKGIEVIRRKTKLGLASAYISGFKLALAKNYDFIITMDADFSHDPKYLPLMLEKINEGYDLVLGSRYIRGGKVRNWPIHRRLLSWFGNLYVRKVTRLPINDLTSGFMLFRRQALENIDLDSILSKGYSFLIEIKYRVVRENKRVTEIPIVFMGRREGTSKISGESIFETIFIVWHFRFCGI